MNKKKLISVIFVIMIVILFLTNVTVYGFSVSNMTGTKPTGDSATSINNFGQGVIRIITTVGSIGSVILLIVLGIKYMMGSAEERADYKKSLFPYFIGAFILFGASTIASIIYNVAIQL